MLVLVKNLNNNEYFTISYRDIDKFLSLNDFFNKDKEVKEFNFEIIQDIKEIKKILDENFSSKGRGGEYNEQLSSVTKIAYGLCPKNLNKDKFLLKWMNEHKYTIEDEQKSRHILKLGNLLHAVLEHYICDTEARKQDKYLIKQIDILKNSKKPSKKIQEQVYKRIDDDIIKYTYKAFQDEEILYKIPELESLKNEFLETARRCLHDFIKEVLINIDLIYSEIFIVTDDIQGSIDLVAYKDNKYTILDFKTCSSIDKKTGKPKLKTPSQTDDYGKQLYLYDKLLKQSGMSHCSNDEYPEFYIAQIHTLNGKYKLFNIPVEVVKKQGEIVEDVLQWYWGIRNGSITEYPKEEDEEDDYFISL